MSRPSSDVPTILIGSARAVSTSPENSPNPDAFPLLLVPFHPTRCYPRRNTVPPHDPRTPSLASVFWLNRLLEVAEGRDVVDAPADGRAVSPAWPPKYPRPSPVAPPQRADSRRPW
eukprot:54917_1